MGGAGETAVQWLLVVLGGALGAVARYGVTAALTRALGTGFPTGTLVVNCVGCAAIGAVNTLLDGGVLPAWCRALVTAGFLGALTTFSSHAWDTLVLVRRRHALRGAANVLANVAAALALVTLGHLAARPFCPPTSSSSASSSASSSSLPHPGTSLLAGQPDEGVEIVEI